MSQTIEQRLSDMGFELPAAARAVAAYVPVVQMRKLLVTSGQLPLNDGALVARGLLGRDIDVAEGQHAARWCAANVLAQVKATLGDLEQIKRLVKITVFVASIPDFTEHHLVANGASEFLMAALGDKGRHARSAIGVASLPLDAPVEVEAMFEVE